MGPLTAAAVERSAAPAATRVAIERLADVVPALIERLEADEHLRTALIAITGASRSMTQRLVGDPAGIEVLGALGTRPPIGDDLERWRHHELLRVATRDLVGLDSFDTVVRAISTLADDVLVEAVRRSGQDGLAVIAMGKLGGSELNYASDIDVLFVGEGDARAVMDVARTCFRIDANLRPEGRDGPLVRTLPSYEAYWDQWAEPWEFQALLKARPAAGPHELGAAFARAAAERVWLRPFGADELRSLRAMKARVEGELSRRGLADREVKRGRGGIRDVEFSVQLLQLVHGRADPDLRSPTTLDALDALASHGYVAGDDAAALADAYRFLRTVEHRLQLVDEQQVHAVPADTAARERLARVLGHRDGPEATALARFDAELRSHQSTVRAIHERLYFRPLLEVFSGNPAAVLVPDAVRARLSAFGFADAERTRVALEELTTGLTRTSRLMQQLLPALLGWLSESPDPDLGLLGLRTLATSGPAAQKLVSTFRESNEAARRLCLLLGTTRHTPRMVRRQPELLATLSDDARLVAPPTPMPPAALRMRGTVEERGEALRRHRETEEARVVAADVLGLVGLRATGRALATLADHVVAAALEVVAPDVPLAVIGLGRLGGGELSYASDLDVVVVHDGPDDVAVRATEALFRLLRGATPAERIYDVDAALRPEGRQGPLSRSVEAYESYYERWAETWERQAMLRARPVAGDEEVAGRFMEVVRAFVARSLTDDDERAIRRMKARVERERIPAGEDPAFHLKLGKGSLSDVEWTVQLLQMRHGIHGAGTLDALAQLRAVGVVADDDARVLADAYEFCERTRNRWTLVKGEPGHSLPARADQLARLARSLDTSPGQLREDYRRVTRRSRQVVERLFYGAV